MVKVQFTTQGCSANLRESELMAGLLKKSGYEISLDDQKNNADIHIVNICTVKKDTTPLNAIKKIKKEHPRKRIVVAGCITDSILPKIKEIDNTVSFVNTHNFGRISAVVEQVGQGHHLELLDKKYESKVDLPSIRKNPVIGIVPILNGCNYFCTFCSTKLVKGKLFSYPMHSIKEDVKRHVHEGCKEIWITSNDTGAYMVDQGGKQKIVELLDDLLSIPLEFKIRVGMMNPGNTLSVLDELIESYKHPKMFKFLHIPLQAGNDEVLKGMNRQYTVDQFLEVVDAFKKEIPDLTLSTDIIVGFPGETEAQFQDTLEVIKKVKFGVLNLSRYSAREGTIASKMKQLHSGQVKDRSRLITKEFESISKEQNKKWLGWKGSILIDEKGKHDSWIGRNYAYKPVVVRGDFSLGQEIKVGIKETTTYDLRGDLSR